MIEPGHFLRDVAGRAGFRPISDATDAELEALEERAIRHLVAIMVERARRQLEAAGSDSSAAPE